MHLAIVIPAYNENRAIQAVLERLPKKLSAIDTISCLVVDDGSDDQTGSIAKAQGATVVRHRINLGLGGAIITGLAAADRLDADLVVTMDADGQHNPAELAKLIQPILKKQADVVIGTRLKDPTGMPWYRLVGNWIFNGITYLMSGVWTTDSQSGYRAFSRHAIKRLELQTNGYEISSEIIVEIGKRQLRLIEHPIQAIYTQYSKVKGQPALNGLNILIKLFLRGIGGPLS